MKSIINTRDNDNAAIPLPIADSIDLAFRSAAIAICLCAVDFSSRSQQFQHNAFAALIILGVLYVATTTLLSSRRSTNETTNESTAKSFEIPAKHQHLPVQLSYLDCLLLGVSILLLPVSVITVTVIGILTLSRAMAIGGATLLSGHMFTLGLGALLAIGLNQPSFTGKPVEPTQLLSLLIAAVFLCFVMWRLYCRESTITGMVQKLNVSNMELKLNNYKLAKYLSPSLRKAIFSGKRVTLETQRKRVSIFFSDIKGFSELSEELEADTLTSMLNFYLTEMSEIALKFGGTVDKFIGDAIMVFFGDPVTKGAKEDCIACVSMAIAMQKRMQDLNKRWAAQGIRQALSLRMGINTGFCTVGNFGTESRLDYTLLGTEVNKASRLESAANANEILISRQTYELIKDTIYCEPRGNLQLKGFKDPVEVFSAIDLRANLGRYDSNCVEHSTEGFSMFLDVDSVPHLQKHRILSSLEVAYEQLRKDIELSTKDDVKIIK